jgi:hypothetical protein
MCATTTEQQQRNPTTIQEVAMFKMFKMTKLTLAAICTFSFGLAFSLNVSAEDPNCYQCARYCESLFYWCNSDFDTCYAIYRECYSGCGCDIELP